MQLLQVRGRALGRAPRRVLVVQFLQLPPPWKVSPTRSIHLQKTRVVNNMGVLLH